MRSTIAEINTLSLRQNFQLLRSFAPNSAIMPMVKANAYGHGIIECSKILSDEGAEFLGVAFASEGMLLREAGIPTPIVVMTPPETSELSLFIEYSFHAIACSLETVRRISVEAARQGGVAQLHLYIDTGMSRDGIMPDDALTFMDEVKNLSHIEWVGICTHFATSDEKDTTFAEFQLKLFNQVLENLANNGYFFKYIHASNTAAIAHLPSARFDLIRPGLSLHGCGATEEIALQLHLQPTLKLRSSIISLRRVPAGTPVSYGRKYFTTKETTIATIPIGYGDGYFRSLTGKAECLIHGKRYAIVGTICMDECMVDIGDDMMECGEEVVLIGRQGDEIITANQVAEKCGTIPYEVLTAISARVPRVFI
ncbi:MAG: alanine racemase [Ignavibacteriae bacterium]|nr:alanine racemase [Ignavibacteriota bacterium]